MIEQQIINGKDVWLKIDPFYPQRDNAHIIPAEYFTVSYYLQPESLEETEKGEVIADEDGSPKVFESPVAALSYARKKLESVL